MPPTPVPPPPASSSRRFTILAALIVIPWIVAGILYYQSRTKDAGDRAEVVAPADQAAKPGPWGPLTLTPIVISPPLEYVSADWGRNEPAVWIFENTALDTVNAFLTSVGLTSAQLSGLAARTRTDAQIRGVVVHPPPDLVKSLSQDVRGRLYTMLAKSTRNFDQAQSFRFIATETRQWFDGTLMSTATRRLVEPLVYRDGSFLHFADIESIRSEISSPEERQLLAKALLRSATYIVKVQVSTPEDVERAAAYWGTGGRRTDIRPLLESISAAGDTRSIDMVHLLPSFARDHLYRYPKIQTADLTQPLLANCLWSSLNFFEPRPDDRYLDVAFALNALRTRYYVVEHGYQLGDIVAMVDEEGDLFHVAVYLADGLLFTKNGTSPVAPWTIMTTEHLKDFYRRRAENPRLIYHRLNAY